MRVLLLLLAVLLAFLQYKLWLGSGGQREVAALRAQVAKQDAENRRLQQEVATARERQEQLERENATLRDQSHRNWFIAGAGAVLGGVLCGLVIPSVAARRRKRRWDQF